MEGCWCNDDTCIHNVDCIKCGIVPNLEVAHFPGKGTFVECRSYNDKREDERDV